MITLETTTQFRRDYKRAKKRGYNMKLLGDVIDTLLSDVPLEPRHRDHPLTGSMRDTTNATSSLTGC